MNENDPDPVEADDTDEGAGKGLLAGGAAAAGGAGAAAKSALDKAREAAAGAKDAAAGAVDGATGAASGVQGGVGDAFSGATDAASGAVSGVQDAATGATSGVQDAATGVVAGGAAASAAVASTTASTGSSDDDDRGAAVVAGAAATGATVGATTQMSGGSGGSGSGGSGSGGGDDDDEKLIGAAPVSGDNQIVILGLLVFLFMFFGGTLWAFLGFGGDDEVLLGDASMEELAGSNPECAAVLSELEGSDELDATDFEGVTCSVVDGEVVLDGEVASDSIRSSVTAIAAGATVAGTAVDLDTDDVTVAEVEEEEVEEVVEEEPEEQTAAAETTTTTEAPETTTTTEAETTTTEAAAEPVTMWDALLGSGEATQFSVIGGALGLQDDLELMVDADGNPIMRTLFAPSDAALTALGQEGITALSSDPDAAAALVGYHFVDEPLTAADLIALDGEIVTTRTQLPLNVAVVDGNVVLNGTTTVTSTDFVADNGIVHIVDVVLSPPTLNQVLNLDNIEFDSAQATITAAGQTTLGVAVDFFEANPTVNAAIEGHTDTDGGDAFNQELSQARADSVLQFLVDAGLDAERFSATGFGETQPILVDGVEDKEASRRIEFVVQ